MPIYDYRCTSCGFEKEYLQKISDPLMTVCPQCNTESFVKKLTAAGFQLKGSGWYATDFRNGSSSKPAAGDAKADAKTDSKPDSKPDSGGEGKSESGGDSKSEPAATAHACGSGGCATCS
jgi:putative FmdB family regulatory protein